MKVRLHAVATQITQGMLDGTEELPRRCIRSLNTLHGSSIILHHSKDMTFRGRANLGDWVVDDCFKSTVLTDEEFQWFNFEEIK